MVDTTMRGSTTRQFTRTAWGMVLAAMLVAGCGQHHAPRTLAGVGATVGLLTAVYGTVLLANCESTACRIGTSGAIVFGVDLIVLAILAHR
jgi:hypothetical protein